MGFNGISPLVNFDITNWKILMLLMGKSTISMAMFNSKLLFYQRVKRKTVGKTVEKRCLGHILGPIFLTINVGGFSEIQAWNRGLIYGPYFMESSICLFKTPIHRHQRQISRSLSHVGVEAALDGPWKLLCRAKNGWAKHAPMGWKWNFSVA